MWFRMNSGREAPHRLVFRTGRRSVEVSNVLASGERESYVLWAGAGRLLEVRIDGVRGRDVIAHVFDARSGAPIDARVKEGVRAWTGRTPSTGDYRIEVARTGSGDPARYVLVVSIRD